MGGGQFVLGQAGMGETFVQGLDRARGLESQRGELLLRQIKLARNGFHFPGIQPQHFVPAGYCVSEAAQKTSENRTALRRVYFNEHWCALSRAFALNAERSYVVDADQIALLNCAVCGRR